ncbi:hypothetical protein ACFV2X_46375 [Streptomyces sp. NPDC059679]|uniref:hypothetical protein n=1 Tax=Streptomyces sp. NPDC059679 TaxID=3346903 RepID=UPI003698C894
MSKVHFLGQADAAHYPFHADAITLDGTRSDKVQVVPSSGVTPRGYGKTFGRRAARSFSLGSALAQAGDDGPVSSVVLATFLRVLVEPT